nr:prephenate dehydrogenase/arogenate dehydrogenase family protein [Desulfobacterales bacterium]
MIGAQNQVQRLQELRDNIDTIDLEILRLLEKRMRYSKEIGALKKGSKVDIYQPQREEEVYRRLTSLSNGELLSDGALRSIFSEIMSASRSVQESVLRSADRGDNDFDQHTRYREGPLNGMPHDGQRIRISIVGGKGQMGSLFKHFFEEKGHLVEVLGKEDEPFFEERLKDSDIVIVSVPINVTAEVIKKIGSCIKPESLLMDLTSIKTEPVKAMLSFSRCEVIGTHPLFGPKISSLKGQTVVLTPARGKSWLPWLLDIFGSAGIITTISTPERHDLLMALTQCIRHLNTMILSKLIREVGLDPQQIIKYSTPIFKAEIWWIGRLFSQDPALYADLQMKNPELTEILKLYSNAVDELVSMISKKNREEFFKFFKASRQYFGSIQDTAVAKSDKLVDEIVKL